MNENVKSILDKFRKRVITEARKNLTRQKKKASGRLYKDLSSDVEVYRSGNFALSFDITEYGEFVDKGVSGTERKYNTPFKFTNKQPPTRVILPWLKQKGIKGRGKNGRFIKQNTLAFLIARSIKKKGLKPSLFFTKPFENEYKKLSDDLVEAFGLDVDEFLKYTLNKYE